MLCCLEWNHPSSSKLPGVILTGAKPPEVVAIALSLQLEWSFLEVMVAINSLIGQPGIREKSVSPHSWGTQIDQAYLNGFGEEMFPREN